MINHPNLEDQKVEGNDFDPTDPDNMSKVSKKKLRETKFGKIVTGNNVIGQVIGRGLDVAEKFLPGYVGTARDLFQLNQKVMLKDIISRTFGKDGGSLIRVRNKDGKIDKEAIIATAIRLALLVGVVYGAKALGILDQVLPALGL